MFGLKDKTAIITGAASGIGKAVAVLFAKQGALVHLLDMNEDALALAAGEINNAGGNATAHKVHVDIQQEIKTAFEKIAVADILVNCAGISNIGKADTTSEDDFDKVYRVNVKGMYNCLHIAIPMMKKNNGGVILNMASIASSVGIPDRFAYSMSKGAVVGMTLSVAKDYLNDGIRCNCISPARVHTPFVDNFLAKTYPGQEKEMFEKLSKTQPIGRMATPDEIAHLVLYLCSNEASFITGCDYPIDGGFIKLNN
ncbi:SDR family NAD(P)-dependent oxidoreductase [Ferruginibacter sp.]|nr:SDR family oxidoreductase [Ferruginibacter sp.]